MYDDELENQAEEAASSPLILPEDEEALLRTIEITKEVLSSPRIAKSDLLYYALEQWESLAAHLQDTQASDLVGQVTGLLEEILRRKHVTFEEARRGKRTVRGIAKFLGLCRRPDPESWD